MSLKVWLPLNGDLENRGCSDFTYTTSIIGGYEQGKIGQALSLLNSKLVFTIPSLNGATKFSVAFWYKPRSNENLTGNWYNIISFTAKSADESVTAPWRCESSYGNSYYISHHNNVGSPIDGGHGSLVSTRDKWYHICLTCDGIAYTKAYVDGILKSTAAYQGGHLTGAVGIADESTKPDGLLNDVRIYDHALSAAEVKEISQGLVVHYKLDDAVGFTDIIKNQNDYVVYNNFSSSGTTGNLVNLSEYYNGTVVRRETLVPNDSSISNFRNSLGSHGVYGHRQTFLANTKYVFWIYYRPISHTNIRVGGTASNIGGWTEIPPVSIGGGWYRVGQYRDGTVNVDKTDNIFTSFYLTTAESGVPIIIDWASPHLLQGTIEIPPYDYPSTIIQDSSGYNHNGNVTGNIITESSSSRYLTHTNFKDSSCAINIGNLSTLIPDGIFTFNIWFKKITDEWSSKSWETILGGPSGFELEGKLSSTQNAYIHPYSWGGGSTTTPKDGYSIPYTLDEWHMLTMVRSTSNTKFYLDGELKVTGSAGSIPSGDYFIGAWQTNAKQNYRGHLSDARIYCTSLLDSDIKMLYNTNMSIDNLSNIHTFNFEETSNNILAGVPLTKAYGNRGELFTNYNSNGEPEFTANGTSAGTDFIPITPGIYEYDYTITTNAGNMFDIGFERFDKDKTSRSNAACVYIRANTSECTHQHFQGTVDLSTDGVNPCAYIALRVLNGWSGTTSGVTGQATIHNISLRLKSDTNKAQLTKQGNLIIEEIKEDTKASFHKLGIVEASTFIEK